MKTVTAFLTAALLCASAAAEQPKVQRCLKANACAFHLVALATKNPFLQLSVMDTEAAKWSEADWDLAVEHTRERAKWAKENSREAMLAYETMPETAPYFGTAMAQVRAMRRFSVGTVDTRRTKAPRKGVPGWTASNAPSRAGLSIE